MSEAVSIPVKLGKKAVKHDPRTFRLTSYLSPSIVPPPASHYLLEVKNWPMYLNDQLGCCVPAASGHMIEQWTTYGDGVLAARIPTADDILQAYEAIGGYVPGDPSTDGGCVVLDALNYWRKTGIAGHKIHAYASIPVPAGGSRLPILTMLHQVMNSVHLFGNCYLGISLPLSAQGKDKWEVDDSDPSAAEAGSWGGHCVPIVGYSPSRLIVVTWGGLLDMSWEFYAQYTDEAYAVLSLDWLGKDGHAPNGFDTAQLETDLALATF